MPRPLSFEEMRRAARRRLPRGLFDYIDRGVGEEAGLRALRARLDSVEIAPRVLRSDKTRSIAGMLFGDALDAPFIIAPTAMAGLVRAQGEVTLARIAARHGLPVCLSTQSITAVERLRDGAPDATIWMQLYLWQERALSLGLLERAKAAGAGVLVMTVDTPYGARKEWNIRNGFGVPFRFTTRSLADLALHPRWLMGAALPNMLRDGLPSLGNYPDGMRPTLTGGPTDPRVALRRDLSWDDVAWARDHWRGALVLKGVLTVEDAQQAAAIGADGIVVSSHGARNLDAAPAPIDVLPGIAAAVGDRLVVLADSGVRRGLDVLRYRLRGAAAVMLGRLPLWALAAGGADGLDAALSALRAEYVEALDFAGVGDFGDPGDPCAAVTAPRAGTTPG